MLNSDIVVVVPVKNEEDYLGRCIKSILSQDYKDGMISIVVVDNGSNDRSFEIANSFGEQVKVIKRHDGTIGALRNFGIKFSNSKFIGFLDGDSVAPVNWISTGCKILCSSSDIAAVGFAPSKPDSTESWVARIWYEMCSASKYSGCQSVSWLSSFNLLLRRDKFLDVGGFDETLTTCEDYDLGVRLSEKYILIYSDEISIIHLGTVKNIKNFYTKELWRGKNNFHTCLKNRLTANSFLSIVVPIYYIIMLTLNCMNIVYNFMPIGYAILLLILAPFAMTVRKVNRANWHNCMHIFLLYNVYLFARGVSCFVAVWSR